MVAGSVIKQLAAKTITLKSSYAIFLNLVTLAEAACKVGSERKKYGIDIYQSVPWASLDSIRGLVHQTHLFECNELCAEVATEMPKLIQLEKAIQFILENNEDPKHLFVSDILNNFLDKKVENKKMDRNIANKLKRSDVEVLLTIQEQLENIENFLLDDQKLENEDTLYAVEMAFIIISNQIKEDKVNGTGLSIDFMKKYPLNIATKEVDPRFLVTWGELLERGNEYIHNYYMIDPRDVLNICQTKFPIIRSRIQVICNQIQLTEKSAIFLAEVEGSKQPEKRGIEEDIPPMAVKKQKVLEKPSQQKDLLNELEEEYQPKSEHQTASFRLG